MATESNNSVVQRCDNCNAALTGSFCSECGQNDKNYDRSLWRVVGDLLREQFDIHSRISRTLRMLFLQPGELAIEFRQNRRASYVAPIRMYLFSSLLFFFLAAIAPTDESGGPLVDFVYDGNQDYDEQVSVDSSESRKTDTLASSIDEHDQSQETPQPQLGDSEVDEMQEINVDATDDWVEKLRELTNDRVHQMAREVLIRPDESNSKGILYLYLTPVREGEVVDKLYVRFLPLVVKVTYDHEQLWKDVRNNLALTMIVLLPWLLFTSALFHSGSGIRLVHQLVFCMHVFALAFLVLSLEILLVRFLLDQVEGTWRISLLVSGALLVHTFVAYQNFYSNGPIAGFFKFFFLMLLYWFAWSISFLLVLAYSVFSL